MFLAVLGLCVASCLAEPPSIGYSYSAYAPLSHAYSHGYPSYYNQPYPAVISAHAPSELKSQYQTSDIYGQTSYGHSESHQAHHAVQDAHGNKVGSYSYVKPDGQIHQTSYVADADGYRVTSNDLPVAHVPHVAPVAAVLPVAHPALPAVPHETPEVIAAKAAHFAAHAQALAHHSLHKRSLYPYASPVVTAHGYVADTAEVAAAKAAHFAEHAKRGNYHVAPYAAYGAGAYGAGAYYTPYSHAAAVTADGYLADTPEVAAAKAAHLAEKAKVTVGHYGAPIAHYGAPVAAYAAPHPAVGADGHVLDTPEVAAAKSAHYAEYAAAAARAATHGPYHSAAHGPYHSAGYSPLYAAHSPAYYAAPVVLPDGHLADTADVAHAKAAHFAEYAKVASRHKRSLLAGAYAAPTLVAAPLLGYSSHPVHPFVRPVTSTAVVHGPHAVSYVHQA